jgi:Fur family transcriptional regulator, ferric uptake regulator
MATAATTEAGTILIVAVTIIILVTLVENGYHRRMSTSETTWSQRALAELRAAGHRRGLARGRVIDFLEAQDCCVGAQEIHRQLSSRGEQVGLASVYRVLDVLVAKRLVQRVDLGDGVTRYEPVGGSVDHHHHIVCDDCGRIEPFADQRLERVLRDVEKSSGYAVAGHDIVLRGACSACLSRRL